MYLVTGGAGFVGSNLVAGLDRQGISDILIVDNLRSADKRPNLGSVRFTDYVDKDEFLPRLEAGKLGTSLEAVLHQGACTDTMATDTAYVMRNNFEYSKALLRDALSRRIPFIYASSASWQLYRQLEASNAMRLFVGSGGYADGEQRRDFIWVGDVVDVNLYFVAGPVRKGIFNTGTGESRSFNDTARNLMRHHGGGSVSYVPFPQELEGKYQSHTQADVTTLRGAGYTRPFTSLEDGIAGYWAAVAG